MPPPAATSDARPAGGAPSEPWWIRAFGPAYRTVYGHRDAAEATRNAPAVLARLAVGVGARVLDLGCGDGRYARALAALGCRVTGIDLSDALLDEARRASPMLPGAPTYVRADMRALPFGPQFDAVVSLFTSFGYFDDPADDQLVLDGVARVLVPGGRFLLDFLNAAEVRAGLVAADASDRGPYHVEVARRIDDATAGGPYVRKAVHVVDRRGGTTVIDVEERVRLYEPAALDAMLARAGLEPVGVATGDFAGTPWTPQAARWIRVAAKPGRGRR